MQEAQEAQVPSLVQEDPLEKEMATHSNILASRIPWTEEPGGCSPRGRKESDTTEYSTAEQQVLVSFYFMHSNLYMSTPASQSIPLCSISPLDVWVSISGLQIVSLLTKVHTSFGFL